MIFVGVKLYKAVYNLEVYSLLGLLEVALLPQGSCTGWKTYEYPLTTFPFKENSQYGLQHVSVCSGVWAAKTFRYMEHGHKIF